MSTINITTEELNALDEDKIESALNKADDWSNYDELYRAANSIHIRRGLLERCVTPYNKKTTQAAKTLLANQLTNAGYTLSFDDSNALVAVTPPEDAVAVPPYDPFVVTAPGDVVNHDDDATAITLREALSNDPNYHTNYAYFANPIVVNLDSPIDIDKRTIISYPKNNTTQQATINGDLNIASGVLTLTGVIFNGNITIAPDGKLEMSKNPCTFSGTLTGGNLELNGKITLNGDIHGLRTLVYSASPTITLGENSNVDLTGTIVGCSRYTPNFNISTRTWGSESTYLNKCGIDFSNVAGFTYSTDYAVMNAVFQIGSWEITGTDTLRRFEYVDRPTKHVYELSEDAMRIYWKEVLSGNVNEESTYSANGLTFDDAVKSGFTLIGFSDDLPTGNVNYSNYLRAYSAMTIQGNGIESNSLNGKNFYAYAYEMQLKDLTFSGTLFGGRRTRNYSFTLGSVRNYSDRGSLEDNSSLVLDGVRLAEGSRIYGGGSVTIEGETLTQNDVNVNIADSYIGQGVSIYGAGLADVTNGKLSLTNVTLDIESTNDDTRSGNIYAGGYMSAQGGEVNISGSVNTLVRSGHFNYVGNGTRTKAGNSAVQGESTLRIAGGEFDGPVYAGGFSMGGEAVVNGSTLLEISGGKFNKEIYGGCAANKAKFGSYTLIDGSANTRIVAGEAPIVFERSIFAGSYGAGTILGNDGVGITLTFTGNGDVIEWRDTSRIYGSCQLRRGAITGSRELIFDAFSNTEMKSFGMLDEMNGFDTVRALNGSNVTFTRQASLSNIGQWELEVGSTLAWENDAAASDCNDLSGDTLDIGGLSRDMQETTLLTGCDILNWDAASVKFNGGELCTCSDGIYSDGTFRLWLDGNSVKVGLLASA